VQLGEPPHQREPDPEPDPEAALGPPLALVESHEGLEERHDCAASIPVPMSSTRSSTSWSRSGAITRIVPPPGVDFGA